MTELPAVPGQQPGQRSSNNPRQRNVPCPRRPDRSSSSTPHTPSRTIACSSCRPRCWRWPRRTAHSGRITGRSSRWRPGCSCSTVCCRCRRAGWCSGFGRKVLMAAFFLGTGRRPARGRFRPRAGLAGDRAGRGWRICGDLPPDRHDDAGRSRGRQTRPVDRRQRCVRQCGCGAGAGGDGVPRQRRRLAGCLPGARCCCARWRA